MKKNPDYEAGFRRTLDDAENEPIDPATKYAVEARKVLLRKLTIGAAAVLVVGLAAGGVLYLRHDTPAKQLARARVDIQQGKHTAAIIELKRSLQGDIAQPAARYLLGSELMWVGDARGASIELQKAFDGGYSRAEVLPPLVHSLLLQEKFDQVVSLVNDASIDSPEINADLQTMLATAYFGLDKVDAAHGALEAAKDLVPNYSGALLAEARYLAAHADYPGAEALIKRIPDADTRQDDLQSLRGDIARALNKPAEAAVAYQASLDHNPRILSVRISLAQTYIDLRDWDKAQTIIRGIVNENPKNPTGLYLAAVVFYAKHDLPAAREAITKSTQLWPADLKAQLLAGAVAQDVGDLVGAEAHLREATQLDPRNLEARLLLARLSLARQQPVAADEAITPALKDFPANPNVVYLAVQTALARGDRARAAMLLDRVGLLKSTDVDSNLRAASLRFATGNSTAGFAQLAAASAAIPASPEIDVATILARLEQRQVDAAKTAWTHLHDREPDNPRTYNLLATIDRARGDQVAARHSLEHAIALDPQYFLAVSDLTVLDVREKKVDVARDRLKKFIATSPHPVDAILLLAQVEETAGADPKTVGALLEQARAADPKSEEAISRQIAFRARTNDVAGEIASAEDGLKIAPNNQKFLWVVGDLSLRTGKTERAAVVLGKLAALNRENPDYRVRLGMAQLAQSQYEPALTSFREAMKAAPRRADLQVATVSALVAANRLDEAGRLLFDLGAGDPGSLVLAELDGDVKLAAKQLPEAVGRYQEVLAKAPSLSVAIKTANALSLSKKRGAAAEVTRDWLASHPKDAPMWVFDAQLALSTKDYVRAEADYRKALEISPNDPLVLNNLAWLLDRTGNPQALAFAEKANSIVPGNPDLGDTLGWILVQRGDAQRGVDLIERASTMAPQKLDIRLRLAKAQLKVGRTSDARSTLKGLVASAPESDEAKESKELLSKL